MPTLEHGHHAWQGNLDYHHDEIEHIHREEASIEIRAHYASPCF